MKRILHNITAAAAALAIAAAPAAGFSANAADAVKQQPVFKYFNANEVNGRVIIVLPEELTATAEITFDSPEGPDEPYYNSSLASNGTYTFDIEGRDTTNDDYRNYKLTVTAVGGEYSDQTAVYTDTFNVPDVNDNPNSFKEFRYTFTVDDIMSANDWDVTTDETGAKLIALHNNSFMYGDVDENGMVNSSDASDVLAEYSLMSTSGQSTFTEKKKKAADVNGDKKIDAKDASDILSYYSALSTGGSPEWKVVTDMKKAQEAAATSTTTKATAATTTKATAATTTKATAATTTKATAATTTKATAATTTKATAATTTKATAATTTKATAATTTKATAAVTTKAK